MICKQSSKSLGLVKYRCAGTQRAGGKEKWLWGIKSLGVKIHTCTSKTQAYNVTGKYRVSTHTPSVGDGKMSRDEISEESVSMQPVSSPMNI